MRRLLLAAMLCLASITANAAGDPLPSGYLSVLGNQIVDGSGNNVRLACVGYNEPTGNFSSDMAAIRSAGFNCARYPYYDVTLDLTTMDAIVTAAAANNVRIIFDHHGNEADNSCLGQQSNGLWYDLNSTGHASTDGTDGCGTTGTINYAAFKANWVTIATHYAGNSTVIGFDLHNEPLTYGTGQSPNLGWGTGTGSDIKAMFQDVGSAINAVNPGVLIICEGPISNGPNLFNGVAIGVDLTMDLSLAGSQPVTISNKVVYSVHDYPTIVSSVTPDSGPTKITAMNNAWGFLVSGHTAPVWLGEMGANLDNSDGDLTDQTAWATMITNYLNGLSGGSGGPTFTGTQQPMGSDWWTFGYLPGQALNGIQNADGSLKSGQQTYWTTLLYHASGGGSGGATTTWNPSDATAGVVLTATNSIASMTIAAGQGVRSTTAKSSGKFCAKVTLGAISSDMAVGISTATENMLGFLGGSSSLGIGLYPEFGGQQIYINGGLVSSGAAATSAPGDVITVALDATAQKVWFSDAAMVAAGTTWDNTATDNPATGVGGISISFISPPYFLESNSQEAGASFTAAFQPAGCPSGFGPWDTVVVNNGRPMTVILGSNRRVMDGIRPVSFSVH